MKRREFMALVGSTTVAGPLAAPAQQAVPVVGFLHPQSPEGYVEPMPGFRQGLKDAGYVEGENLAVEYHWANNQTERLSALAADLVRRRVAVIAGAVGASGAHRPTRGAIFRTPQLIGRSDAAMEDRSFLKAVTVLLSAVFGLVLLTASTFSHSSLDSGLGVVLLIVAFFLLVVWFLRR